VKHLLHLPIQYYGIVKKLAEMGKWPFKVEKVVTERECYETVRKGRICKEEGYTIITYNGSEVGVILTCDRLEYMDTTGFGAHEHYSSYLCRLETESPYGVRLVSNNYVGPGLAEFVLEVYGTDYDFSYKLGKILWVYDAEKGKIVVLPKGGE